jgi:hypothetical protein
VKAKKPDPCIVIWLPAKTMMPDSDITVLIHIEDGEVWTGFHDGSCWRYVSGDRVDCKVIHWSHFPNPPAK